MKILSSIISSFWNTVTFMDKEQRALVAHVLTVSQAHPKSFNHNDGLWKSQILKITFDKSINSVWLSNVKYKLGWRASAILARHFAMLHICLHHENTGKALSDIDKSENSSKDAHKKESFNTYDNQQTVGDIKPPMTIDLAKYVGKNCYVEMSNGDKGNCYVNYLQTKDAVLLLDFDKLFNRQGSYGDGSLHVTLIRELEGSFRDCTKTDDVIKPVDNFESLDLSGWTDDIDLTQWVGKTVDVKLRNDTIVNAVSVNPRAGKTLYQVKVEHVSYTRWGKFWHDRLDGRDIMAIRPTT